MLLLNRGATAIGFDANSKHMGDTITFGVPHISRGPSSIFKAFLADRLLGGVRVTSSEDGKVGDFRGGSSSSTDLSSFKDCEVFSMQVTGTDGQFIELIIKLMN